MRCTHCRREIPEDSFFCPYCGLVVNKKADQAKEQGIGDFEKSGEKKLIYGIDLSKGRPAKESTQKPERKPAESPTGKLGEELDQQLKQLGKDWDEEHGIDEDGEWTGDGWTDEDWTDEEWTDSQDMSKARDWTDSQDWTDDMERLRKKNVASRRGQEIERPRKKSNKHLILIGVIIFAMLALITASWLILSSLDAKEKRSGAKEKAELEAQQELQEKQKKASEETKPQTEGGQAEDIEMSFVSEPELGEYYKLPVAEAEATSVISQEGTDNGADKAVDGNERTSWQEGVDGDGVGESIQLKLEKTYNVKYMSFQLGNWNSDKYYRGNNRPKELEITVGEVTQTVTFPDGQTEYWLELSEECPASEIEVAIASVYAGSQWDDTCIAEMGFYGKSE